MDKVKPLTICKSIKIAEEACDAAWTEYQKMVVAERKARAQCAGARENFRQTVKKREALKGKLPLHLV
jgi:hypothetical protein